MVHPRLAAEKILEQADSCVKCGLCLPHCPTYGLARDEAESPRGRIALAQGLLNGALPDGKRLRLHLDHCLGCRACETVCPSEVSITAIIDGARAQQLTRRPAPARAGVRGLLGIAARPGAAMRLLQAYRRSGLSAPLRRSGLLRRLGLERAEALIPPQLAAYRGLSGHYPAIGERRGHVALFPGCLGRYLDHAALAAAVRLLPHLGFGVTVPRQSRCCGALHRHGGLPEAADRTLARAEGLFSDTEFDTVLVTASACAGELRRAAHLAPRIQEASRFIADLEWPERARLTPLHQEVLTHVPCTQRHLLGDPNAAADLLRRVPGLVIRALADGGQCCGAAGSYLLRYPNWSDALLQPKIEAVRDRPAPLLATTNTGCALHLRAGLARAGLRVAVCHPLQILAQQLAPDASGAA
jgi:glycolate oxidase iron-sulfur subunit